MTGCEPDPFIKVTVMALLLKTSGRFPFELLKSVVGGRESLLEENFSGGPGELRNFLRRDGLACAVAKENSGDSF